MLSTAIFGGDDVSEKLDMVLDKLNVIEQDMNTLIAMTQQTLMVLDGSHYDGLHRYYTAFQDLLTGLTVENRICEANLKLIYDNLQNYSEEELNAAVAEVMRNWGDRPIAGFSAYGAFDQLYNKLVDSGPMYYGALRNIFSVYDVIVFHNTPWEKTGYDMRDMFRAAVAAETVRTAWLTNLYYRTVRPNDFQYFTSGLTTKSRTFPHFLQAVAIALTDVTTESCASFQAHCLYSMQTPLRHTKVGLITEIHGTNSMVRNMFSPKATSQAMTFLPPAIPS